ncbi:polysaccharide deacetylase family protein [Kitasatospora sp. NPDC096147]|uniref:polysaccharide deacetylase family protein n=1 Tax=Kitasatospora sp. NPDC096147 TaxID=3364093 RepID=UPI0038211A25
MRTPRHRSRLALPALLAALLAGCSTAAPVAAGGPGTATPSATTSPTQTPTAMPTPSPTPARTRTPSAVPRPPSPDPRPPSPSQSPSQSPSPSPSRTSAPKPRPTPTATPTRTATPSPAPSTPKPPPPQGTSVEVVSSTGTGRGVALTFDDGPGPATGPVLDLLARYGVRATFCVTGKNAAAHPELVRRIRADGHRLCDHSVNHPQPFAALSPQRTAEEIVNAKAMIVQAGGPGTQVPWFRAPGGAFTEANRTLAARNGLRPLGWSVDPRDWSRPGADAILHRVQHDLRPGGVVLLHDGGGDRTQTVTALAGLLPWLTANGYACTFPAT